MMKFIMEMLTIKSLPLFKLVMCCFMMQLCTGTSTMRHLQNGQCSSDDEIYCGHVCRNMTDYNISPIICDHTFQLVQCINPRDQLWNGINYGDYYPGCAEYDAPNETAIPTLPNYPRMNNDACNNNFNVNSFVDTSYPNSIALNDGDGAIFQYYVPNDSDVIKGRLIFNGIFGYIAFGFAGTGSSNKMHNARVIVAKPGDNYSPRFGLNLTLPSSVEEYIIDPVETTFRIWGKQSYDQIATSDEETEPVYLVESDECYTILSFETNHIADQYFASKTSDSETMIWAANNMDAYMQYHGNNRGTFAIDYTSSVTGTPDTSDGFSISLVATSTAIAAITILFLVS